jgi:hypothetical protein
MSKPFSLQAPENIAKQYAGNKQRIAEAARMGLVDPTAAVLAGMFIDRMRGAQMQEGATPPTVAQEVMGGPTAAPSPPAGGLGGPAPTAPPMTPGMPEPQMPQPMQGAGLEGVPVPEGMFGAEYAGGGLVAFNEGGKTSYYGRDINPLGNEELIRQLYGERDTKYAKEMEEEYLRERSPEARKKARDVDLGYALMAAGSKMASTPGGLFQSLGAGIGEAAPVLMQSAKERKAEEREIRKGLIDLEEGSNSVRAQRAAAQLAMSEGAIRSAEAETARNANIEAERAKLESAERIARETNATRLQVAGISAAAAAGGEDRKVTTGQLNEQAKQMLGRLEEVQNRMYDAHNEGNYDKFRAAARELISARAGYNTVMRKLELPEMPPLSNFEFPKFAARIAEQAAKNKTTRARNATMGAARGGTGNVRVFDPTTGDFR